jgi:hypothetical protein
MPVPQFDLSDWKDSAGKYFHYLDQCEKDGKVTFAEFNTLVWDIDPHRSYD